MVRGNYDAIIIFDIIFSLTSGQKKILHFKKTAYPAKSKFIRNPVESTLSERTCKYEDSIRKGPIKRFALKNEKTIVEEFPNSAFGFIVRDFENVKHFIGFYRASLKRGGLLKVSNSSRRLYESKFLIIHETSTKVSAIGVIPERSTRLRSFIEKFEFRKKIMSPNKRLLRL